MAFQSVPNTAELTIVGEVSGQEVINTYYARWDSPYTLLDLANLAAIGDAWWDTDMKPNVGPGYTYRHAHVQGLNAAIDMEAEDSTHTGATGTAAGVTLPNNVSLSVKRASAFTGRGARGRVYWPALTNAMLADETHIFPLTAGQIATALQNLHDLINDAGRREVIVHRVEAGVKLSVAATFDVVEYVVVDYALDSMRRRLAGRGV